MEQNTGNKFLKSTARKIKEPDFSKEIVITKLNATNEAIKWHYENLKKSFGNKLTEQEIWKRINALILRDNVFNEAMKILVSCCEIKIDIDELKRVTQFIKETNKNLTNMNPQNFEIMARRMIERQLIFDMIEKAWNVTVTDEEVKENINDYYKRTNQPVRDILNNEKTMKQIKASLLIQKLIDEICKKLKWKADWDAIKKSAAQQNKIKMDKNQQKS